MRRHRSHARPTRFLLPFAERSLTYYHFRLVCQTVVAWIGTNNGIDKAGEDSEDEDGPGTAHARPFTKISKGASRGVAGGQYVCLAPVRDGRS